MANVLNRQTKEYLVSVNTPDYPEEFWIINPDMSAVDSVPQKYWVIEGDSVRAMTSEEQAAYDAQVPPVVYKQFLEDGTPCFMRDGVALSYEKLNLEFNAKVNGATGFNLEYGAGYAYPVRHKARIESVQFTHRAQSEVELQITCGQISKNVTTVGGSLVQTLDLDLEAGDLKVKVADGLAFLPTLTIELRWRD